MYSVYVRHQRGDLSAVDCRGWAAELDAGRAMELASDMMRVEHVTEVIVYADANREAFSARRDDAGVWRLWVCSDPSGDWL